MAKRMFISAALVSIAGCAARYTEPTLPADHPASPTGAELPPPERSRVLDLAAAEPVAPASAAMPMDHSGHDAHTTPETPAGALGGEHGHAAAPAAPQAVSPATVKYVCPMHPEVTSDKPDQRCPKCGMKLKKVDGQAGGQP